MFLRMRLYLVRATPTRDTPFIDCFWAKSRPERELQWRPTKTEAWWIKVSIANWSSNSLSIPIFPKLNQGNVFRIRDTGGWYDHSSWKRTFHDGKGRKWLQRTQRRQSAGWPWASCQVHYSEKQQSLTGSGSLGEPHHRCSWAQGHRKAWKARWSPGWARQLAEQSCQWKPRPAGQ
jgi:hypothetical protein